MTNNDNLRIEALRLAIGVHSTHAIDGNAAVLETAELFYRFLIGETKDMLAPCQPA